MPAAVTGARNANTVPLARRRPPPFAAARRHSPQQPPGNSRHRAHQECRSGAASAALRHMGWRAPRPSPDGQMGMGRGRWEKDEPQGTLALSLRSVLW